MLTLRIERCQSRMMKEQLAVERIVGNLVDRLHLVQMTKWFLIFSLDLWNILLEWFLCILVKKKKKWQWHLSSSLKRRWNNFCQQWALFLFWRLFNTWENKTKTHPMLFSQHPLPPFRLGAWSSAIACYLLCLSSEVHLLWNCRGQRPWVTHSYRCRFSPFYL